MTTLVVRDVMTRDVEVVRRDADVHELEKLLLAKQVHGVPVVDSDGVLVGVVSQTDLLFWHFNTGVDGAGFYNDSELLQADEPASSPLRLSDIKSAPVEEVMSPVVHCIKPDRPLAVAASTMIEKRIHRLVVVNEELHVIGLVSAIDLLRALPGVEHLLPSEHRVGAQ
jgi:CBS-domain-containing membrane protein